MCLLFIFVDMGQPGRVLNVLLYPTPDSIMFWDMVVLSGYLLLNAVIGGITLGAERKDVPPPRWILPVIILSIPWAVSIHTVTAFLYSGLPGRHLWLTALLAPRFLASGFASGPALRVPWMWASMALAVISLVLLITPRYRANERLLAVACVMVFASLWIDKGMGLIVGGVVPSPLGHVPPYVPTLPEVSITLAIWAVGVLMLTVLYKMALAVREELA